MEALHIDAFQIIFAVINFLILVGVLTKFLTMLPIRTNWRIGSSTNTTSV